ncbi:uncharacterized protein FPRO_14796 [Fusarium proliferatum ET1]|uniref:AAA+ ATPase domain-containing protein n=1 Tax=Fusarium proliferatum (strain ET1) TaxID=1227346 RepID=A0A1L7WAT2_FUSPR|nr:uncharacterized protein FPRO_14796 [Fusarium proliferatum ET1]CZR49727.1 uncharacterized protein FPRO_14796 [Fusarium proliferatum ET1]
MNMARYFHIASDPVERDIDEMFWVPRGPKLFAETELAKYLKNNKLQQHTAHYDRWVDQPRPKRLAETYHHEHLNAMIAEVRDFFDAGSKYAKEGRKWKRVYLLHGAPGTGKTAMPDVIASVLDVPLYRHACGSTEDQFRQLINATRPKSLVVFDEIDQLSAAQPDKGGDDTEGSERQPIKKQTLQSWLCGELGAEGTVIFLTTNHLRKIDEVIRRPQRVDKMLHFPAELTKGTINKILQIRYDNENADCGLQENIFRGRTAGGLHQFLDNKDYESAIKHLGKWLLEQPAVEHREASLKDVDVSGSNGIHTEDASSKLL